MVTREMEGKEVIRSITGKQCSLYGVSETVFYVERREIDGFALSTYWTETYNAAESANRCRQFVQAIDGTIYSFIIIRSL